MTHQHLEEFERLWRVEFPDVSPPVLACFTEHEKPHDFEAQLIDSVASCKNRIAELESELKQQQFVATYLEKLATVMHTDSSHSNDHLSVASAAHRPLRPKSPLVTDKISTNTGKKPDADSPGATANRDNEHPALSPHGTAAGKVTKSESLSGAVSIGKKSVITNRAESVSIPRVATDPAVGERGVSSISEPGATTSDANVPSRPNISWLSDLRKALSTEDVLEAGAHDPAEPQSGPKRSQDDGALLSPYRKNADEYEYVWRAQSGVSDQDADRLKLEHENDLFTPTSSVSQSQEDLDEYLADEPSNLAPDVGQANTLKFSDVERQHSETDADTLRRQHVSTAGPVAGARTMQRSESDTTAAVAATNPAAVTSKPVTVTETDAIQEESVSNLKRPPRSMRLRRMTINDRLSMAAAVLQATAAVSDVDVVDVDVDVGADSPASASAGAKDDPSQAQTAVGELKSEAKSQRRSVERPPDTDSRPPLPPRSTRVDVPPKVVVGAVELNVDASSSAKRDYRASANVDELERIEVLSKVLENEALYLDVLDVLNQYMKSMEASATTSARFMPLESVQAIFSRIRDLYSLHKQFYEQLSVRVQRAQLAIQGGNTAAKPAIAAQRPLRTPNAAAVPAAPDPPAYELRVCDLFLPLISQLNIAREYANNYTRAVHTVKRYSVENMQFAELARAIRLKRSKEVCTLETLLFKPVLRMQRHIDILRELLAATRPSHPDHAELEAMLKIAQHTVSSSISQAAAQVGQASAAQTYNLGLGHTMDSFSPGSLVRASLMVELVHDSRKLRHVFLFSNLFVCSKLNQANDQFEIKWFIPLRELIVYKVDDNLQEDARSKRRSEIAAIKQRIASLRSELRRELQAAADQAPAGGEGRKISVISAVDPVESAALNQASNSNVKEGVSMWSLRNVGSSSSQLTAAQKSIDRLRKKLAEQKAALVLASPSLLFELSRNSEKRYRFVMSSKFERDEWKTQIKTLRNRLLPSYSLNVADAPPRVTVLEVKLLIESCRLVSPQVNELGKVLLSGDADLLGDERGDLDDSTADAESLSHGLSGSSSRLSALSGSLFITICALECPAHRNSDLFVCLEVDSHGQFDLQARTRLVRNTSDRVVFDQEFELALDRSLTVRLLCYGRSQSLGEYLIAHADFSLVRDFRPTEGSFAKRQVNLRAISNEGDERQPVLEISARYVAPEQTIKRSAPSSGPSSASKSSLFGVPLEVVVKREPSHTPLVMRVCIDEIEQRGLQEVGIYRISGASSEVQELRRAFERDPAAASSTLGDHDIHAVSNVLKLFLRELPEPLFTDQLYRSVVDGYQIADTAAREKCMLGLLRSLPAPNYATLMCLFDHLLKIAENASSNRMTLQNLSTVFGPSLLRPAFRNELIKGKLEAGAGAPNQPELSLSKLTQDALMEASVVLYCIELRKLHRGTALMLTEDDSANSSAPMATNQNYATPTPAPTPAPASQADTVDSPAVSTATTASSEDATVVATDSSSKPRFPKHDLSVVHRIELVHGATQRIRDRGANTETQPQPQPKAEPSVSAGPVSQFKQAQNMLAAAINRSTSSANHATAEVESGGTRRSVAAALATPVPLPPTAESTPPVATVSPTEASSGLNFSRSFQSAQASVHAQLLSQSTSQRSSKPPPPPISTPPRKPPPRIAEKSQAQPPADAETGRLPR